MAVTVINSVGAKSFGRAQISSTVDMDPLADRIDGWCATYNVLYAVHWTSGMVLIKQTDESSCPSNSMSTSSEMAPWVTHAQDGSRTVVLKQSEKY